MDCVSVVQSQVTCDVSRKSPAPPHMVLCTRSVSGCEDSAQQALIRHSMSVGVALGDTVAHSHSYPHQSEQFPDLINTQQITAPLHDSNEVSGCEGWL